MDEQVRRAFKIIQRAGAPLTHPGMTLEELKENHGNVLFEWLKKENINCSVFYDRGYFSYNGPTKSKLLLSHLETKLGQKIDISYYNYFDTAPQHYRSILAAETDTEESIIIKTLSSISPTVLDSITRLKDGMVYHKKNSHSNKEFHLTLVFHAQSNQEVKKLQDVEGNLGPPITRMCTPVFWVYTVQTADELSKKELVKQQKEQKRQKTLEEKKKKQQIEELALLQKLKEKYEATQDSLL